MVFEGTGREDDVVIRGYIEQVKDRIASLIEQGRQLQKGRLDEAELVLE
jgi:hypothetical protein